MDDQQATDRLVQLLRDEPDRLRIITAERAPLAQTLDPRNPDFNVLEPVGRIDAEGDVLIAVGRAGSLCMGLPLDLLVRLTEWAHYDPAAPELTRERTLAALE